MQLRRIAEARAKVRARVWALFGGPPQARAAGRDIGAGVVVLDVDSTIVIAHSDKDGAAPTYKHTYGFHPILVTCDNTGELLAVDAAAGQRRREHRRRPPRRAEPRRSPRSPPRTAGICSSAATAPRPPTRCWTGSPRRAPPGRRVEYSIGWSIGEAERAAIAALPASAWSPAIDADGGVRDGAEVAELTGLLALAGWPAGMRVIVRRERPHPGAQLSLFEERDGWRYTAFVTNTQTTPAAATDRPSPCPVHTLGRVSRGRIVR